ncbi:MAG: hypothetical protein ACRERC_18205 [Candidatus Binatia bacterium]
MSDYMPKVADQEDYGYVITLGMEGVGDGQGKLVTVGAKRETMRCSFTILL